ncbi:hypothetical protein Tco_0571805 [Tanacetum coccineum]
MGQCVSSSSSNGGVAPEPPTAVPMTFTIRISNERKKEKIVAALLKLWVIFREGHRRFNTNEDGLEISMMGNFVPGTLDMCLQKSKGDAETEGLNKYNVLLRTTNTTQEEKEPLVDVRVRVKVRGSTNVFVDALESLEAERRKWLEDTAFYKLIDMGRNIQNNALIKKLATMFNTEDHNIELEGQRHVLTLEDVTEILGIVDGEEEEIKMPKRGQTTDVPSWLKKDFVERGKKGST